MGHLDGWLAGFRPYLLLSLLCLLLYMPGISSIPPLDRDEARFAQASRQMLETGDFLRIRFQEEARNKKPAGIYWLQAAAVAAFSDPESNAIWPYRLPSLLGAAAAAWLTFAFGRRVFLPSTDPIRARRVALIAAMLLASSLGIVTEAHIAKTDAALLAAIVAGQGALGLAYVRARAGQPIGLGIPAVFWLAEAVAILLKGPPGLALAIVTAGALSIADHDARWLRGLRPILGLALLVLAIAPWVVAIEGASGGRFLADSLGQDLMGKILGAQESHGAPPFSYLLLGVLTFWPASLLLVPIIMHLWQRRETAPQRFLLAWIAPAWIILELVPTKLPHYIVPLYPALALAAAAALTEGLPLLRASWAARVDIAVRCLWAIVTLVLATALIVLPLRFGDQSSPVGILGALLLVGLAAWLLYRRPDGVVLVLGMVALSTAFVVSAMLGVLPGLDRLWLSRSAAALVAQHPPPAGAPLVAIGYNEPSLVFLLGTATRLATAGAAAEALVHGGEALVSGREDAMFRQALTARGLSAQPLGNVRGTDYSNGQRMVLTLYSVGSD
jgi:4-amino-4-deoxy-L-arabinose transferase-like glycosyltransferase